MIRIKTRIMIKYSTQVEDAGDGQFRTTVKIGVQTFQVYVPKLVKGHRGMTQQQYNQWYADQMKKALDNLVNSIKSI